MFTSCRLTTYVLYGFASWSPQLLCSECLSGVLTLLVSFKKCSFNSIAHYSLTNKTHSHQRLKYYHHFQVIFQLAWSYLSAWYTPFELSRGEWKSNCSFLRHVKHLDESKSFKSSWKTVSSKLAITLIRNIWSPHEDNIPSYERN